MTANYTKGEWKFEDSDLTIRSNDFKNGSQMGDYKGVIIADLKPALGCDDCHNFEWKNTGREFAIPQTVSNAHLIAAAPDMYEAIINFMDACEKSKVVKFDSNVGKKYCVLRNAITKAKGENNE